MKAVYDKCGTLSRCLITIDEIFYKLPKKHRLTPNTIEQTVRSLELDDYFDVVYTEKRGNVVLCVNLHQKGLSYKREMVQLRRAVILKIALALMSAFITFAIGRILFYFF